MKNVKKRFCIAHKKLKRTFNQTYKLLISEDGNHVIRFNTYFVLQKKREKNKYLQSILLGGPLLLTLGQLLVRLLFDLLPLPLCLLPIAHDSSNR